MSDIQKATPRPWTWENCASEGQVDIGACRIWTHNGIRDHVICSGHMTDATAKFIVTAANEYDALNAAAEALKLLKAHRDDLSESNPGFMRKLSLQDYDLWNRAELAAENALKGLEKIRSDKGIQP